MFGLYPLHPEAVAWITGRVDLFVTFFFMVTFYGYLRWRQSNEHKWLYLSMLSFICSLLSKEMAIMLPPLIFWYESIFGLSYQKNSTSEHKTISKGGVIRAALMRACWQTGLFWLTLIGYILWRAYALGTLIGGYDSTYRIVAKLAPCSLIFGNIPYICFLFLLISLYLTNGRFIIIFWLALLLLEPFFVCEVCSSRQGEF